MVIDLFSRWVFGWSVVAHTRAELLADALALATATPGRSH
jgi:transposase InsO family protein